MLIVNDGVKFGALALFALFDYLLYQITGYLILQCVVNHILSNLSRLHTFAYPKNDKEIKDSFKGKQADDNLWESLTEGESYLTFFHSFCLSRHTRLESRVHSTYTKFSISRG